MKIYCILFIGLATLCQAHRNKSALDLKTSYYVGRPVGLSKMKHLTIRKNPNIFEFNIQGYDDFTVGIWKLNKDTLFLIPQYIIHQYQDSNEIIKLENYFNFESLDETLDKDWRPIICYIVRKNGLFGQWEVLSPYTQMLYRDDYKVISEPDAIFFHKITPKTKRRLENKKKYKKKQCN